MAATTEPTKLVERRHPLNAARPARLRRCQSPLLRRLCTNALPMAIPSPPAIIASATAMMIAAAKIAPCSSDIRHMLHHHATRRGYRVPSCGQATAAASRFNTGRSVGLSAAPGIKLNTRLRLPPAVAIVSSPQLRGVPTATQPNPRNQGAPLTKRGGDPAHRGLDR